MAAPSTRAVIIAALVATVLLTAPTAHTQTAPTSSASSDNVVIMDLLSGQPNWYVPHVYLGACSQSPNTWYSTSKWPVYYGPGNASQYWGSGSTQPVLELVPAQKGCAGAMFWQAYYEERRNVTITLIGVYTRGYRPPNLADGFVIYLFLTPSKWNISPRYNYSIPFLPLGAVKNVVIAGSVVAPESARPYVMVQWDPFYVQTKYPGEWNVFIVDNFADNLTSARVLASWGGIGKGFLAPNPGDFIKITVTYDPTTNTLTGKAVDLNTGRSSSFTLNLSGNFTPPLSGNYVFGVGANTGWGIANWGLLYVSHSATTLPTTTATYVLPWADPVMHKPNEYHSAVVFLLSEDTNITIFDKLGGSVVKRLSGKAGDVLKWEPASPGAVIEATRPVMAYYVYENNDYGVYDDFAYSYALLPSHLWGTEYYVWTNSTVLAILSLHDNNTIYIDVNGDRQFEVVKRLGRGEVYVYKGVKAGTYVKSDYPVAVAVANFDDTISSNTYAYEVYPTSLLSDEYYAPYPNPNENKYRNPTYMHKVVIGAVRDTTVYVDENRDGRPERVVSLGRGQWYVYENPKPGARIYGTAPFYAVYIFDVYARDPWAGVYRHYVYAYPLPPKALAGTTFIYEEARYDTHAVLSQVNIFVLEDGTEIGVYTTKGLEKSFTGMRGDVVQIAGTSSGVKIIKTSKPVIATYSVIGGWYGTSEAARGHTLIPNLRYSTPYYNVTFVASGLPPGVEWGVTLNGTTKYSTTNRITFTVPPGRYTYLVNTPSGYVASPLNGTLLIEDNATVQIVFTPAYSIVVSVYNVDNKPANTTPGVVYGMLYNYVGELVATAYMDSKSQLVFNVPPGTYTLYVYHYPNTGLNHTEYWGNMRLKVAGGERLNFVRNTPWIKDIQANADNQVQVVVFNPLETTVQGQVIVYASQTQSLSNAIQQSQSVTLRPGLNTYKIQLPPTVSKTWYMYVIVQADIKQPKGMPITTDQWHWTQISRLQYYTVKFVLNGLRQDAQVSMELCRATVGTTWQVTSNCYQPTYASSNIFVFNVPAGYYEYNVLNLPSGYYAIPSSKAIIDVADNTIIDINFETDYLKVVPVTIRAIGLPKQYEKSWYIEYDNIILPPSELNINNRRSQGMTINLPAGRNLQLIKVKSLVEDYKPYPAVITINTSMLLDKYDPTTNTWSKENHYSMLKLVVAFSRSRLVAVSGWDITYNSYSVPNFGTNGSAGGNCYGFASTAILYYLKQLKYPQSDVKHTSQLRLGQIYWLIPKGVWLNPNTLTNASLALLIHQLFDPNNRWNSYYFDSVDLTDEKIIPAVINITDGSRISGELIYRGVVILKARQDNKLEIFDPSYPDTTLTADYDPRKKELVYTDPDNTKYYYALSRSKVTPIKFNIEEVLNNIRSGKPVEIGLVWLDKGTDLHSVVAWGYVELGGGSYALLLYDPNFPQVTTVAIYNSTLGLLKYENPVLASYVGFNQVVPTPAQWSWFSYFPDWIFYYKYLNPYKFINPWYSNFVFYYIILRSNNFLSTYYLFVAPVPFSITASYGGADYSAQFTGSKSVPGDRFISNIPGAVGYVDGYPNAPVYIAAVPLKYRVRVDVDPNSSAGLFVGFFANSTDSVEFRGYVVNSTANYLSVSVQNSSVVLYSPSGLVNVSLFQLSYNASEVHVINFTASPNSAVKITPNWSNLGSSSVENAPVYTVTFTASGLPRGARWSVALDGVNKSSTSAEINFTVLPGAHVYSVSAPEGYTASPSSGVLNISKDVRVSVSFSPNQPAQSNATREGRPAAQSFTVTFVAYGLPEGARWGVSLGGVAKYSTSNVIAFTLPAGEYSYVVYAPEGYTALPSGGAIRVSSDLTVTVRFYGAPEASATATRAGVRKTTTTVITIVQPRNDVWIAAAVIIILGGAAAAALLLLRRR